MKAKIAVDVHEMCLATAFSMVCIPKALTVFNPFSASLSGDPRAAFYSGLRGGQMLGAVWSPGFEQQQVLQVASCAEDLAVSTGRQ